MGVDGHVTRRSAQAFSLTVRDVLFTCHQPSPYIHSRLGISVLLGHTEVDNVNSISALCSGTADEEVIWFDISVDQILFVNRLYPGKLA